MLVRALNGSGGGTEPKSYYLYNCSSVESCGMGELSETNGVIDDQYLYNPISSIASVDVFFAEPKKIKVYSSNTSTLTMYKSDGTNSVVGSVGAAGSTMTDCIGLSGITSNQVQFHLVEVV